MDNLQAGIDACKSGKIDEARKYLASALKENPKNENAWGWMYRASKDDKERIFCLRKIIEINPTNEQAKLQLNKLVPPIKEPVAVEPPKYVVPAKASAKADPKQAKNVLIGIGAVISICVIAFCVIWFLGSALFPSTPKDHKTMAYIQCQLHVEDMLKSPASAKFPSSLDTNIHDMGNNTFEIRSYVDSQNSFGAMIRTNFFCKIQYTGNEKDDDANSKLWNLLQLDFIQ